MSEQQEGPPPSEWPSPNQTAYGNAGSDDQPEEEPAGEEEEPAGEGQGG